jgi:heme-degrading monooxygenase HmoA
VSGPPDVGFRDAEAHENDRFGSGGRNRLKSIWPKQLLAVSQESSEVSMTHIRADNQPVTQITIVDSEPDKQSEALSVMTERARFMARQPGFISISLHRSLDGRRIVNYVQWQSRDLLKSAHQGPEFRKEWGRFDELTDEIDPNLYEVAEVIDGGQ